MNDFHVVRGQGIDFRTSIHAKIHHVAASQIGKAGGIGEFHRIPIVGNDSALAGRGSERKNVTTIAILIRQ